MSQPLRIALISGEPSGDLLGATLLRGLRDKVAFDAQGVGGPRMQAEGLESRIDQSEFAVMGLSAVLARLPRLLKHLRRLADWVVETEPDILVTIDSPALSFRLAKQVKARGAKTRLIHLVAPSVWAWKPERAAKVAGFLDGLLTLLPFEPPYFEAHGLPSRFVGHPAAQRWQNLTRAQAREQLSWSLEEKVLLVLPGSRTSEIKRLAPVFGGTLALSLPDQPVDRLVVPTLSHLEPLVRQVTASWPRQPEILTASDARDAAMAAGDVALCASGTASLELAAAGAATLVGYSFGPLSDWYFARQLQTPYVSLVNILAQEEIQPERLGPKCQPTELAPVLSNLLSSPSLTSTQAANQSAQVAKLLPPGGQAEAAMADALLELYHGTP